MKTVGVVAGLMLVLAGGMAADKGNADATAVPSDVDRAAGIDGDLYDIGLLSSIFSLLASGNTQRAADGIGSELLTRVRLFDGYLEQHSRPEDLPARKRVYRMLRLVAAVDRHYSIPRLRADAAAQKTLAAAVADDPEHYQQLLARAAHWQQGIR